MAFPSSSTSFGGSNMFSAKLLNAQQQGLTNPLFGGGSSTAAQPAPGTNPFTTNPGIAQPAAGTNVFGGAAQPASGGNLFGGTAQSSTNIFGAPAQTAAPGTGMFGGTTQQAPPGTNIFGAPAGNQPQTGQQQINTSLFQPTFGATQTQQTAASAQQQQQQPGLGASFFGNPQQQQLQQQQQQGQQQANSNPFASFSPFKPTTSQPQTGSSLWGNNTFGASVAPKQPQFGFGASTLQPSIGASQPSQPLFTKTTKFNDLPEEVRRVFEPIDAHIQGRIQISKDLKQRKLGEEALRAQELFKSVRKDLQSAGMTTETDLALTRDIKLQTEQAVLDTMLMMKIVDSFRSGAVAGQAGQNITNGTGAAGPGGLSPRESAFPIEFFKRVTEQMKERLTWYKKTIQQIEKKLSGAATQTPHSPQSITSALQAQYATFLTLASSTAAADAELQKIKTLYTTLWRGKTGSSRDPFEDSAGDAGWEALESLSVR